MRYDGGYVVFFQAEDGIRDLVRSRGLGDVYKRQTLDDRVSSFTTRTFTLDVRYPETGGTFAFSNNTSVSYTHLTLPTSDLV